MNKFKQKIKNIRIPFNQSTMAFAFSIFAVAFAVGSFDSPCLSAQSTCAIGSDNIFSGNISLKGGTANKGTFDAAGMTADRTWTLPDASGTLAVAGATLPASKVMATDVSGNESTTDVYPLTLTGSEVVKTDPSGNITTGLIDITTNIDSSSASVNDEIRVGSGGLEYFTPASGGGGRWTLVGQGTAEHYYGDMTICWYDDTQGTGIGGGLDQTKVYKLVVEPTLEFLQSNYPNNSSYPKMVPMADTSCTSMPSSSNYLFNSSVTDNGLWATSIFGWKTSGTVYNSPWLNYQQGTSTNTTSNACGGASIDMNIRNGIDLNGASANTLNQGVKVEVTAYAPCFSNATGNVIGYQSQESRGLFWDSTQLASASGVNNMNEATGIMLKSYDMQSGAGAGTPPVWYLYESAH